MPVNFDEVLSNIGALGRYQRLLILGCIYLGIQYGFQFFATVLIFYEPNYRCNLSSSENIHADSISYETFCADFGCDGCKKYFPNTTDNSIYYESNETCDLGFTYEKSLVDRTVVTEFDLICDRKFLQSVSTSMFLLGYLVGSAVFGDVTDRIGRKKVMFVTTFLTAVSLGGCAMTNNFWVLTVFKMFTSTFISGSTNSTFIFACEQFNLKWRGWIGAIQHVAYCFGYVTATLVFAYTRNYKTFQWVGLGMFAPAVLILIFPPESPRWLLAVGREEKAKKVSKQLARFNNKVFTDEMWENAKSENTKMVVKEEKPNDSDKQYSYIDLFRTVVIRILTLKIIYIWFANGLVYTGIAYNISSLSGNLFIDNIISSMVDFVSSTFCLLTLNKFGRKKLELLMTMVSGVSLLLATVLFQYSTLNSVAFTIGRVFVFLARFGVTASYTVLYTYTAELYPTVIRSAGFNLGAIFTNIGGTIAPYILFIRVYVEWAPNTIFATTILLASVLHVTLPETKSISLLQTIENAEKFHSKK